jgi:DNA-binding CsgD family transcriptional regulator
MTGGAAVCDEHPQKPGSGVLTPRQTQVLALIANGASTKQIAQILHISEETVRNHVRHALVRLRVHSRAEAVAVAYRTGLL